MTVTFYSTFIKKFNSTKTPPNTAPKVDVTGEIKGDFSPLAPVIRFQGIGFPQTQVPVYRYAYIASFARYYFVRWAFVDGAWEGSFRCDVLGSFAVGIKNSSQYVSRSASNQNPALTDGAYSTTTAMYHNLQSVSQSDIFGADFQDGTYVIGVVADASTTVGETVYPANIGALCYYALSPSAFAELMYKLLNSADWLDIDPTEISESLQKALINPAQYIKTCVWLPIPSAKFVNGTNQGWPADVTADITNTIKFGWWTFTMTYAARKLRRPTSNYDSWSVSFTFPLYHHPDIATFGNWLDLSPYTRRYLQLPMFGAFELDTSKLANGLFNKIEVKYFIHAYNGDASCYVYGATEQEGSIVARLLLSQLRGAVGIQIPVGQVAMNIANMKNALTAGVVAGAGELASTLMEGD